MANENSGFDLIIVGGGLVGNTLAFALRDTGLKIALIETMTREQQLCSALGDRALALSAGTVAALEELGLWPGVAGKAARISDIHVSDKGHFGKTRLSAEKEGVKALGYVITARDIEGYVAGCVGNNGITLFSPARLISLSSDDESVHAGVEFENNIVNLTAKLIVGADGGNSSVRTLAGIPQKISDYGQTALITTVRTTLPHGNTAYERFTESGPLALLPAGNNLCAVVWTRNHEEAAALTAGSEADYLARLQQCFGYRLGALALAAPRRAFPVSLIRAERMQSGRVVIIGNAAHQLHPVAGQGFNLGLRDVTQLSGMIAGQVKQGRDIGELRFLKSYVRERQQDHSRTIAFTDSLVRLFSNNSQLLAAARNAGLTLLDHVPFGKTLLSRHAMGLAQQRGLDASGKT